MKNYVGRFRVRSPKKNDGTFTENLDDTYVVCKNNVEMYRYNDNILALYIPTARTSNKLQKELWHYLTNETKEMITYEIKRDNKLSGEWVFYFEEKYIDLIAKMIKPKIGGAKINPRSNGYTNKSYRYINYKIKNKKDMKILKDKLQDIVSKNKRNLMIYQYFYKFIEKELDINLIEYAKKGKIKPIEAIDKLDSINQAIGLINQFVVSYDLKGKDD